MACIDDVRKAAKDIMTSDEVDSLVKALDKIRRKKRGEPADINREMLKEAEQMIETWVLAAKIEKRNAGFNIIVEARAFEMFDDFKARNPKKNDADAFIDFLVGLGQGGNSIGARMLAKEKGVMGGVISKITDLELWPVVNNRSLDREIAREMWEIGKPEGTPGLTGSKEAKQLADIFHDAQKAVVQMQNDSGAWIGNLPGFIVAQSHNSFKIRNKKLAGKNGELWISKIKDKIDWEATAKGLDVAKRGEFLKNVWRALATGEHHVTKGGENSPKDFAFKGSANLAKKVSSERVLHFKTADDWFDYDVEFGNAHLSESVFGGIERGARNSALMEGLGTNPGHMAEKIKQKLIDRSDDMAVIDKLKGHVKADTVTWYIDEVTGQNRKPGSVGWSVFGSIVKAIESTGLLGGAVLSSANDMATKASQAKFNGISYLEGYENSLSSLFEGKGGKEIRELADILGVGFDGTMGQVANRFGANDSYKGTMNSLVQMTFKWTGLNWWTDAHKTGFSTMLSRNLAIHRGKAWNDLGEDLRNSLSLYFKPEEWDIIRTAHTTSVKGDEYITPQAAKNLSDAQIKDIIGKTAGPMKIRRYRDNLENSIRNYFVDQSESAIPTPGARESALMKMGKRPGSIDGVLTGFFMQFKAFPITFMTKQIGKNFINGKSNIRGVVTLMAMSTAMGYLAMTLKDIAKNRTPRDITKDPLKVFLAAMQQGGGLGIYGDFLFGEGSRFGRSAIGTVMGPAFGSGADLLDIFQGLKKEAIEGDDYDFKTTNKTFRFIRHHAPIVNWWWTKKAFDAMFLNTIQENINPGYLERTRNFSKKHSDQDFLFGAF